MRVREKKANKGDEGGKMHKSSALTSLGPTFLQKCINIKQIVPPVKATRMLHNQRYAFVKVHQVEISEFEHLHNGDPPKLYLNGVPGKRCFHQALIFSNK